MSARRCEAFFLSLVSLRLCEAQTLVLIILMMQPVQLSLGAVSLTADYHNEFPEASPPWKHVPPLRSLRLLFSVARHQFSGGGPTGNLLSLVRQDHLDNP